MKREFTCILCPNGCTVEVTAGMSGKTPEILEIRGNRCPRGRDYVTRELVSPMRTVSGSVLVEGGELPLASVRLSAPIPRDRIPDAMKEIRSLRLKAPVEAGRVLIHDLFGTGSDVIVTRTVRKK